MVVLYLFLVVINIVIYHKLFDVIYFDLGHGLVKEVVVSMFVAAFELGAISLLGPYIVVIAVVIGIIALIVKHQKSKRVNENTSELLANMNSMIKGSVASLKSEEGNPITDRQQQLQKKETISIPASNPQKDTEVLKSNAILKSNDDMICCSNCGNQIPKKAKYCGYCGQAIKEKNE